MIRVASSVALTYAEIPESQLPFVLVGGMLRKNLDKGLRFLGGWFILVPSATEPPATGVEGERTIQSKQET